MILECNAQLSSEAEWLAAAQRGQAEAFTALCRPHVAKLLRTAFRVVRNREDAEDALQDALMRAFVNLKSFRGGSKFSTWLTRVLINSALMIRRKHRSAPLTISLDQTCESSESLSSFEIEDHSPNPHQAHEEAERRKILHTTIRQLRPRTRVVIEFCELAELSTREAASALNITIGATKSRMFHGRAALRRSSALRAVALAHSERGARLSRSLR